MVSHRPSTLPSGSLKYANAPMPGIAVLGVTVVPPALSISVRASSMASTSIVITGARRAIVALHHAAVDRPGSVGICVCSSTGVVTTVAYSPPAIGIECSCHPKMERRSRSSAGISKCTTLRT